MQVNDFYDRPGMVESSFVYGYLSGLKENSAVFWCQDNKKERYYLLVAVRDDRSGLMSCTDMIPWTNYPGGLSIVNDKSISLDEFYYIDTPQERGPKEVKLTHNAILSYYDGVENLFYSHDGKWLVRQRH